MMGVDDMLREHGAWFFKIGSTENGIFPNVHRKQLIFFFILFFSSTLFMYLFLVPIIL
jgi:hypothetical protein